MFNYFTMISYSNSSRTVTMCASLDVTFHLCHKCSDFDLETILFFYHIQMLSYYVNSIQANYVLDL